GGGAGGDGAEGEGEEKQDGREGKQLGQQRRRRRQNDDQPELEQGPRLTECRQRHRRKKRDQRCPTAGSVFRAYISGRASTCSRRPGVGYWAVLVAIIAGFLFAVG